MPFIDSLSLSPSIPGPNTLALLATHRTSGGEKHRRERRAERGRRKEREELLHGEAIRRDQAVYYECNLANMYVQSVHGSGKFYLNPERRGSCRRASFKPGPLNCGSTPLCNVGKQTRGFQKQGNDCLEKNVSEGALAKLELHLSCWIPQLAFESEHAGQDDWRLHRCFTSIHMNITESPL